MLWTTRRILITVKATPNPSAKYGETVCVAGIDMDSGEWIRLYPVPFRDLDKNRRFNKYAIIEAGVRKTQDDKRPASFRINLDSIRRVGYLDADKGWEKRKAVVLPTLSASFCDILRRQTEYDASLGAFRPRDITFGWEKASIKNADRRRACYAQMSFLHPRRRALQPLPFNFRYRFRCEGVADCPGHDLMIIDWEIAAAYYRWRRRYPRTEERLEKIRQKWLGAMCSEQKETTFFVGNTKRFRQTFMILGVFYPPRSGAASPGE